jgi:hypothetical protein
MTTKTANISGEFEKKILNLLKRNSSKFGRSGGLAGGVLGAGGGAAVGIADAARRQLGGEMEGYSSDEIFNDYLSRAGQFASAGLGAGAGLGIMKGKANKNMLATKNVEKLAPYLKDQLSRGATEKELLKQIANIRTHAAHGLEDLPNRGIFSNLQKNMAEMSAPSRGFTNIDDIVARTGTTPESVIAKQLEQAKQEAKYLASKKPDMVTEINNMTSSAPASSANRKNDWITNLARKFGAGKKNQPYQSKGSSPAAPASGFSESEGLKDIIGSAEKKKQMADATAARRLEEAQIRAGTKVLTPEEKAVRDLEAKMVADPKNQKHIEDLAKAQVELAETSRAKELAKQYDQTKDPEVARQLSELNKTRLSRDEAALAQTKQKAEADRLALEQRAAESRAKEINDIPEQAKAQVLKELRRKLDNELAHGNAAEAQKTLRNINSISKGTSKGKKPQKGNKNNKKK